MTGCRIVFTLFLIFGVAAQAGATPIIVQISPLASILNLVAALGGTTVDTIPGANIYLLNVPIVPSPFLSSADVDDPLGGCRGLFEGSQRGGGRQFKSVRAD
jgi:hypothetical protein